MTTTHVEQTANVSLGTQDGYDFFAGQSVVFVWKTESFEPFKISLLLA